MNGELLLDTATAVSEGWKTIARVAVKGAVAGLLYLVPNPVWLSHCQALIRGLAVLFAVAIAFT